MENLTVLSLLKNYEGWVSRGEIQFLEKGSKDQKNVLTILEELISDFQKATDKQQKGEGDISENLDWHKTHSKGRELWEKLASCALYNIEKGTKGNSELFKYVKVATEFEDLLYGLELYYRDHTLHSLWVYFIGENILRNQLPEIHSDLHWYLINDIQRNSKDYSNKLVQKSKQIDELLCKEVNKKRDAIWCIIALCHDLGYSLSKLEKLNEKVENVLKFFNIPNTQRVGYSLDIEHQYLVSQFLELMTLDVRIVPNLEENDIFIKCYRDDSTYWKFCQALEKKQHGILSSYLIYKLLGIFSTSYIVGTAVDWGLEEEDAVENIIRGDILFAIAQHELTYANINQFGSLADVLLLADELEEFSRLGRKILSRKYYDTNAESRIVFKQDHSKKYISFDISYEVAKNHPVDKFFLMKADKICKIYSLDQEPEDNKSPVIKYIKMSVRQDIHKYHFILSRESPPQALLPEIAYKDKTYPKNEYPLVWYNDEILVQFGHGYELSLAEWFEHSTVEFKK